MFQESAIAARTKNPSCVITHGDSGGNVIVLSRDDIYLIDWDEVLLSPAERDTWVLEDISNFLEGYKKVFPDYRPDTEIKSFYILKYYFQSMAQYFAEIIAPEKQHSYRLENLRLLKENLIEGWIKP